MTTRERLKYRAFLSYSHRDDAAAKRVHRRLEGFHIDKNLIGRETTMGPVPKQLRPIFRDRQDFEAGGRLGDQTVAALDASDAMILLASPASALSAPVDAEVRLFCERHPGRPLIPLILDGAPGDPERECFPPALRGTGDLLAADIQKGGDGRELALAKVVARLLGLAPDEVYRRAKRETWRRRFRLWAVGLAPLVVALVTGIVWVGCLWWGVRQVEAEMRFVRIPTGCFNMGSPLTEPGRALDEGPIHRVCLNSFDLGKFEVTQGEWRRVMVFANPLRPNPSTFRGNDRLPVETISWTDAQYFVHLMSVFGRYNYDLPSEAQWEYAARAGTETATYLGEHLDERCAFENLARPSASVEPLKQQPGDCDDGYATTAPVGSFKPNPWGLYDMLGNVAEWTADCYVPNYQHAPVDGSAVNSPGCENRVLRGGSWYGDLRVFRAARRGVVPAGNETNIMGLRIARSVRLY